MRILILSVTLFATFFTTSSSFAAASGTLTCHFEFMTKSSPGSFVTTPPFSFNVKNNYFNDFSFSGLQNKLYVAYYPGLTARGDLRIFIINLKYAGANAGADVPAINGGEYIFKISQDQSDLIGAFLNCTAELK